MSPTRSRHRSLLAGALVLATMGGAGGAAAAGGTPDEATASLHVRALSSFAARADWTVPTGAVTVQVLRDGFLLDQFPVARATRYVDRLLWPSTTYTMEVTFLDAGGGVVADLSQPVTTPAQSGAFPRLYAKTSFWNQRIKANPPIDPGSAAIVQASITPYDAVAIFHNDDQWGVPLAYSDPASTQYSVGCINYGCSTEVLFRIPRSARPNSGSDGKLVVIDPATATELDMGRAVYDPVADAWTTSSRYTAASNGWGAMCAMGLHCDGVLMSGIDQFGGIVRPEEIAQGHIDHALAMVVAYWRSGYFACPAVKSGGGFDDTAAIPLGAHVQLDPSIDVEAQSWPEWEKVVAIALQRYGAYVTDAGSSVLEIRGEANLDRGYDAWDRAGMGTDAGSTRLTDIPWDRMRVLQITQC